MYWLYLMKCLYIYFVKILIILYVAAHPNCVLFLTHGGLFSQQEALHGGVPTVGIPFFGDQPYNMKFSENRGIGVKLDFSTLSEESVATALNTVLSNPS